MNIQHDMSESIDVEQSTSSVVIDINNKLKAISSSFPLNTIFKVHTLLRRENEMAYEPEIVAIGPYHRGKDRLRVMEDRKLCLFKSTLELLGESDATKYVEVMRRLEPEARQCYSESTEHINKDEFVEMLLLDACFIIQFMRRYNTGYVPSLSYFKDWTILSSNRDMLLFENQIPLFVLEELFSMIKLHRDPTHFHELAFTFISHFLENQFGVTQNQLNLSHDNNIEHMLGLVHFMLRSVAKNDHYVNETSKTKWSLQICEKWFEFISESINNQVNNCMKQRDRNIDDRPSCINFIPNASKLHAAGVEFRSKKVRSNPFAIIFENGVMEIPTVKIYDLTESMYRNLIAYEQYNKKPRKHCVSLHVRIMDCLIDSAEDVALLSSFGIISHGLGDNETVCIMFNKLLHEVCVSDHPSEAELFKKVNAYYGKRRHKWMAKLRREYFNSPWAWISFIAAFLLLMFTLTQTIFSILGAV